MPQIVWTADADGKANYFNRRWFEYTGLTEATTEAQSWLRVTHPDDRAQASARRERALRDGTIFESEYRFLGADGTYRWHLGRSVPIRTADGEIDFWIGTATDIDDRKRIEEAQQFLLDAGAKLSLSLLTGGRACKPSRNSPCRESPIVAQSISRTTTALSRCSHSNRPVTSRLSWRARSR